MKSTGSQREGLDKAPVPAITSFGVNCLLLAVLLVAAHLLNGIGLFRSSFASPSEARAEKKAELSEKKQSAEKERPVVKKETPAPKKAPATSNKTVDYTFDDLKFDIEKDAFFERSMLPEKIENYAGSRMRIRGFILPTSFQTGLTRFVLVRDNMECCFGPGAALYDCIVVEMAEGLTTDYSIKPVAVEGKFTIDEFIGPGRKHLAIYKIVADKVE